MLERIQARRLIPPKVYTKAESLIQLVRHKGDTALLQLTRRYDAARLTRGTIRVSAKEFRLARGRVSAGQIKALRFAADRIRKVQGRFLRLARDVRMKDSVAAIGLRFSPLERVGCYVPGGQAAYPSTVLMSAIPAQLAGVKQIVICTPPSRRGDVSPLVLVAAQICGIDEVYKVGGAQAISALAYGTETIPRVDKIVGPGNHYVVAAKQLVSSNVGIDFAAGPTELVIYVTTNARPDLVARDLISQLEHSPQTLCGVVTNSVRQLEAIKDAIYRLIDQIERSDTVSKALARNAFLLLCENEKLAARFISELAPEHLQVFGRTTGAINVARAGLTMLGENSPSAASDYCVGTSHVLPTGGVARSRGGLTPLDFLRPQISVRLSNQGLASIRPWVSELAQAEGLPNHAQAVEARFR